MELNIYGLSCDNPTCDYVDESIKVEEYKDYIGYPCPKCNESLLTQEDYDAVQKLINIQQFAMSAEFQEMMANVDLSSIMENVEENEETRDRDKDIRLSLSLDGKGNFSLNE